MASKVTHYPVYLAVFDRRQHLKHRGIYVGTEDEKDKEKGYLYHTVGSMGSGFTFEVKQVKHPAYDRKFISVQQIGWIVKAKLEEIKTVCETIPPPPKQWDGKKRLVPRRRLRHPQHWTADALEALRQKGIVEDLGPSDDRSIMV
ncbi:hypothetical protein QBC46DRAFT_441455 [Diplogelasinospora grovesii]|uniref:Uncharacterized protein n=1 Tax=Diplogelasinospora grovesii TaxID=303347 RepID=A0AAN6S2I8_9PEZI|nr:hypothetical protein QBC46DRAFT_441455 [Diplogelasinospora grovesii]